MKIEKNKMSLEEFRAKFDLDKLSDNEKLALIAEHAPELPEHKIASIFPPASKSDKENLAESIEYGGQSQPIVLSRNYEIVYGSEILDIQNKRKESGKKVTPIFIFTDCPAESVIDMHFGGKRTNQQQMSALIFMAQSSKEKLKAKKRMKKKSGSESELIGEKGTVSEILARRYKIARLYFDEARTLEIYDKENKKNYLLYVAQGKASYKQMRKLIQAKDRNFVIFIEKALDASEATYDSAEEINVNSDKPAKNQKVGKIFAAIEKKWEASERKKYKKAETDSNSDKNDESVGAKKITMPNSHSSSDLTTTRPTISKEPCFKVRAPLEFSGDFDEKIIMKTLHDVGVALEGNCIASDSYSIGFKDNAKVRYLNISLV